MKSISESLVGTGVDLCERPIKRTQQEDLAFLP